MRDSIQTTARAIMASISHSEQHRTQSYFSLPMALHWLKRPIASNSERCIYILAFASLIAIRLPNVLLQGRFWAEEGNVHFESSWSQPWYKAIVLVHAGYLNLTA